MSGSDTKTTATSRAPAALTVALVLVIVEASAESAFVLARDDYGPGGKALVIAVFGFKVLLATWARRLSAGGALGLLAFELTGLVIATGAAWAIELRFALVACVVAIFVLVLSSLHAFPSPELP